MELIWGKMRIFEKEEIDVRYSCIDGWVHILLLKIIRYSIMIQLRMIELIFMIQIACL